jgi:DNA-binding response OmpR family regulator
MTKVLLAEDDSMMVNLLQTLLGMEGYQTASVLGKDESFLDVVRKEKPDIILLDVHLGSQNGLDLMQSMRNSPDLANMKVIMSSGINMLIECEDAGANDFLLKPYMPDELIKKLRTCLAQNEIH